VGLRGLAGLATDQARPHLGTVLGVEAQARRLLLDYHTRCRTVVAVPNITLQQISSLYTYISSHSMAIVAIHTCTYKLR